MKKILLALFLVAAATPFFAQDCNPDPLYADSVGVYPLPFVEGENGEPDTGGIPDTACLNVFYQTNFTIIVDTFNIDGVEAIPDYLDITDVTNLPAGMTYACDPADCRYYPEEPGCASVYGIPTGPEGDYSLQITGIAYFFGGAIQYPINFPDPSIAPGEYILHVRPEGDALCGDPSAVESPAAINSVAVAPNPFTDFTQISIQAATAGTYNFAVTDLLGRTVNRQTLDVRTGDNTFTFDGSDLAKGIYIYAISQGNKVTSGKLVVE
ncbi:MAG: hypothetical protein ACI85O_001154 [Saprospiraceae bacterium]|jgi:hypothetical protein